MNKYILRAGLLTILILILALVATSVRSQSSSSSEASTNPDIVQTRAQGALQGLYSAEAAYLLIAGTGRYATFEELQKFPEPIPGAAFISPNYTSSSFIYGFRFSLMRVDGDNGKNPMFVAVAWPIMQNPSSLLNPIMIDENGILFRLNSMNGSFIPNDWREIIDSEEKVLDEVGQYEVTEVSGIADTLFLSENANGYIIRREIIHMMSPTALENTIDCTVYLKLQEGPDGLYLAVPFTTY